MDSNDIKQTDTLLESGIRVADLRGGRPHLLCKILDPPLNMVDCQHDITHLTVAASEGCSTCAEKLIQAGADLNKGNKTPVMCAAENGRTKCLKLLLKAGADVNKSEQDGTALKYAICNGSYECACVLIKAGADVNNGNLLYYAAIYNRFRCEELLIKSGADVNASCEDNCPIIFMAAEENRIEFVKLLLQAGARINTKNKLGQNALTIFIAKGEPVKEHMCTLLLAAGETVDVSTVETKSRWNKSLERVSIPDYILHESFAFSLKVTCRHVIRKRLLDLNPHRHLFYRVPRLGLPLTLSEYLLYNVTIGQPITASETNRDAAVEAEYLTSSTETQKEKSSSINCCCVSYRINNHVISPP